MLKEGAVASQDPRDMATLQLLKLRCCCRGDGDLAVETPKKRHESAREAPEPELELEPASGGSRAELPKHSKKASCPWLLSL